jgi:hypothetical protein
VLSAVELTLAVSKEWQRLAAESTSHSSNLYRSNGDDHLENVGGGSLLLERFS